MKQFLVVVFAIVIVAASIYFEWWRCGEMFPNAQLACFLK